MSEIPNDNPPPESELRERIMSPIEPKTLAERWAHKRILELEREAVILLTRPKWKRVLRWPIVWHYHFRIMTKKKQGTLFDKMHIAYLWANLSVTYNPQHHDHQRAQRRRI